MEEALRTYRIRFRADNVTTEEVIRAYSAPDAETLLEKKYGNCKITVITNELQ